MVGRDIGTVVLPEADLKIYLDAIAAPSVPAAATWNAAPAARRSPRSRWSSDCAAATSTIPAASMRRSRSRRDAIVVDSTNLSIEQVMERMRALAEALGRARQQRGDLMCRSAVNASPCGRYIWQPVLNLLIWLVVRVPYDNAGPRCRAPAPALSTTTTSTGSIRCSSAAQRPRYAVPLTKIEASRWPLVGLLAALVSRHLHHPWRRRSRRAEGDLGGAGRRRYLGHLARGHAQPGWPACRRPRKGWPSSPVTTPDCWLIPCAVTGTPAFDFKHFWRRPRVTLDLWPALPLLLARRPGQPRTCCAR